MELKIVKGNREIEPRALYHQGEVYLPVSAIEAYTGLWGDNTLFFNSPLQNKRICLTLISPEVFTDQLPTDIEQFAALCIAAGACIVYHNGGPLPPCDLVVVAELGGRFVNVNYLGFGFRSLPLAHRLGTNLKRGLKLAYLPDPLPFRKPQYNLKISLLARLFTPGIVVQWPASTIELGLWLFTTLMEYFGDGHSLDGSLFARPNTSIPAEKGDDQYSPQEIPESTQAKQPLDTKRAEQPAPLIKAKDGPPIPEKTRPLPASPDQSGGSRQSATMSQTQYPDFFKSIEEQYRQRPKREPFG